MLVRAPGARAHPPRVVRRGTAEASSRECPAHPLSVREQFGAHGTGHAEGSMARLTPGPPGRAHLLHRSRTAHKALAARGRLGNSDPSADDGWKYRRLQDRLIYFPPHHFHLFGVDCDLHKHTHTHARARAHTHPPIRAHTHTRTHAHTHTHTRARTHTPTHARTHPRTHTHAHTHIPRR